MLQWQDRVVSMRSLQGKAEDLATAAKVKAAVTCRQVLGLFLPRTSMFQSFSMLAE